MSRQPTVEKTTGGPPPGDTRPGLPGRCVHWYIGRARWGLRNSRWPLPDLVRGLAILLMAVFHGWYNLSVFDVVEMPASHPFWVIFRALIVSLFCLVAGAGLAWTHARAVQWPVWLHRQTQLFLAALGVTLFTLVAYPDHWVYFGILHFFLVAFALSLPLAGKPRIALLAGLGLIIAERLQAPLTDPWVGTLLKNHLPLPDATLDRTYLLPWLGMVWIGIGTANWRFWRTPLGQGPGLSSLRWIGQHPLSLYLIHQPVLFALALLFFGQ